MSSTDGLPLLARYKHAASAVVCERLLDDCVDASARMLELARRRIARSLPEALNRVRFLNYDICDTSLVQRYDLIVTNFFLDCYENDELESLTNNLKELADNTRRRPANIPRKGHFGLTITSEAVLNNLSQ